MVRDWTGWVVEPSVPEAVRGDYALVAAEHVRAQEPLLYTGFCVGTPCAVLMSEGMPPALRFGVPALVWLMCIAGALANRKVPTTASGAKRSLSVSAAVCGSILAIATLWAILSWRIAPEATRMGFPVFITLGVIVTGYAFAKVRRLAALCLTVGIVPMALAMLGSGNLTERSVALAMLVAMLFMLVMARNNRRFLVELLENRQRLHTLSRIDSLTELPNRRALLEDADRLGMRCERLRLVLIDIDHFKTINDTHGHDVGDEALRAVARVMSGFTRKGVSVARIGGEEFALMGRSDDLSALTGLHVVETLRAARMPHGDTLTVSAGTATGPVKAPGDWRILYAKADQALYEAKAAGRDRAVVRSEREISHASGNEAAERPADRCTRAA